VLGAHGFGASLVVGLINRGLVMIIYEGVRAGSTTIDVTNVPDRAWEAQGDRRLIKGPLIIFEAHVRRSPKFLPFPLRVHYCG
jgi:hypothetical protein